jgi:type IV pilus assembly protein PilY1
MFSGNENFAVNSTPPTTSTFTVTTPGAPQTYPSSGYTTCSLSGSGASTTMTCTLGNGHTASCSTFSSTGGGSPKYYCATFGFPFGETNNANPQTRGSGTTSYGSKTYYNQYRISYLDIPTSNTYYYASSYPGTISGITKYYTSSYNLTFSTSQTFNVRVKVCDTTIGPESNCVQYGSTYKPTGVVQNNGDKMRFGVSSYFQSNNIDNAVLRSKLKYVAPQMYSPSGGVATNPRTEWSSTDGTLYQNPDTSDAATATSFVGTSTNTGVINYINKFGSASHTYKTYDDAGKLYYETLKYLRGGPPTTAFYNGATSANADGFPVITTWDDPILFSCQKNYVITMGDTHTHCDKRLPSGSYASSGPSQCSAYTDGNGNSHAADSGSLSGDTGVNVTTTTNVVGNLEGMGNIAATTTGSGGAGSYSMAGLAGWAASTDIRPGTATNVIGKQTVTSYVIDVQENKDCGYQSQYWLTSKYGNPSSYDSNGTWIAQGSQTGAQQWWSTQALPAGLCSSRTPAAALGNPTYNASGGSVTWPKNLLRAGDPLSMITSVQSAIAAIVAQIGDEAALAQSSGKLDTGTGAYIYRALYNSGGWRGNLQALTIDTSGNISSTPAWSASEKLPLPTARNIFTFNDGLQANGTTETVNSKSRRGVAFDPNNFAANFSTRQQAILNADTFGINDSLGIDRVNYIRGDQSDETFLPGTTTPNPSANNGWRSRLPWTGESRYTLGDIINSNPVFVGPPSSGISDASYKTFASGQTNRVPMVYVGGNDGMLHGLDASFTVGSSGLPVATSTSGQEMFAYIPSSVYPNLPQLMSTGYAHKYYVDGSPTVADACFFGSSSSCPSDGSGWKTVLVGSLKAGGQGIYALDVTNPITSNVGGNVNNFTASNVLWEFTDADDPDMGYSFSVPIIRKLNNGRWAAIFGNGFNNNFADSRSSTTGRAYLYILYIDGPGVNSGNGTGNSWVLNTNYFKIELKSPSEPALATLPLNPPNGLSGITGFDKDFNGTVDYVYGGDRNGNLWKIDLTSNTPSNWKSAFGTVSAPLPLFTAKDTASPTPVAQQVTTGVEIGRNPLGGYFLLFGTGSWIDNTDPLGPFQSQAFYGIWDKDDGTTTVARSNLQRQTTLIYVDGSGNTCLPGAPGCNQIVSSCQPNYTSSVVAAGNVASPLCPASVSSVALGYSANTPAQLGWVFDLPNNGERTRSSAPQLSGNRVTFTTLTPATDPCTGNTIGLEYDLNYKTGGTPPTAVFLTSGSPTGMITIAAGSSAASALGLPTGTSTQVIASGQTLSGGATDNPVNFNANLPSSIYTPPAGIPSPPTSACQGSYGGTCADYIPGWGFLFNQLGGLAKGILSCGPQEIGPGLPTCVWKTVPYQAGRLSWKQIIR